MRAAIVLSALCALGSFLIVGAAHGPGAEPVTPFEPARLLFMVDYIAVDYGEAVHDGRVADPAEYEEMQEYSETLLEQFDVLARDGASAAVRDDLLELQRSIAERRTWDEVRRQASGVAERLRSELKSISIPLEMPDVQLGRALFQSNCAACHGAAGHGDGFASAWLDPPPSDLSGRRSNLLSPLQVHGALTFGIEDTAMPSYADGLPEDELWDLAFFVFTLRDGFAPRTPHVPLPLSLEDLATRSNDDLLSLARRARPEATMADVDFLRQNGPGRP